MRFLILAFAVLAGVAQAQDYPNKPIRLITPAAQGGTTDFLARLVGAKLGEIFKQQVVVDNRASASGVIAGDITAKSPPDGYTLLLAYHQHTINAALNPNLPYHPVNDFTPITQLTRAGLLLIINSASPPKNLKEFVEWTKAKSGELNYGSAGIGSGGHLAGELYKHMVGVKAEHIPYKGTGPAIVDLIGGRYDFNFAGLAGAVPQMRSGKLRGIAVTTPQRIPSLPDIPAMAEAVPGYEVVGWYGVIGPAGMPQPIVTKLHDELVRVLAMPDVRERILHDGSEPVGNEPQVFRDFMTADLNKWAKLVQESGAKLD
ncbi:MAG: tripartite tricarboxylate transporter substrate binding protein [Betaproteobacteria bacterium]|nr:tripartite tricarboxylate transporter substrate binding protein [Betaproteobacteria bacterium]MBV9359958.1 tripartite tricarboxylate transporter substrate binding protein [Betaproteobacteria bacterium]